VICEPKWLIVYVPVKVTLFLQMVNDLGISPDGPVVRGVKDFDFTSPVVNCIV
jgi:hypothetical protein